MQSLEMPDVVLTISSTKDGSVCDALAAILRCPQKIEVGNH